jgi:hypothetical protein
MENREEQGLNYESWTTTSDEFWDRGLEDNPQLPISVALAIDEIVDGSRQVFYTFCFQSTELRHWPQ